MERKIGEVFTCNGKLYQVVKGFSCNGCAFIKNGNCYLDYKFLGPCAYTKRTDRTSVIFKLINNMEIKNNQLTIDIPKGYEIVEIRIVTDSEKKQLFDALAKKGKAWNAEHKIIVNLKLKWITLKPFDKVLVRDGKDEIWEPAFFFRNRPELNVYKYQTVDGKLRVYCIPYNEETAELIGTTKEWK